MKLAPTPASGAGTEGVAAGRHRWGQRLLITLTRACRQPFFTLQPQWLDPVCPESFM